MSRATERPRSAAEWLQFGSAGVIVMVMFYPAIWMVFSAFKSNREIFRTPFALPGEWKWGNLIEAWNVGGLGTLYLNSVFVTVMAVSMCVLFATGAAFAFTRLEFPGRTLMYRVLLVGLLLERAGKAAAGAEAARRGRQEQQLLLLLLPERQPPPRRPLSREGARLPPFPRRLL